MTQRLAGVGLATLLVIAGFGITLPSVHGDDAPGHAYGNHVKVYFRVPSGTGDPTGVLGIRDPTGALVMYAYAKDNDLFVTDGTEDGVESSSLVLPGAVVGSSWHRLDVILHGATYTLHLDQQHTVTARAFTAATQGTWIEDPRGLAGPWNDDVDWAGHRVDDGAMAHDETFTRATPTWETVGDLDAINVRADRGGHLSPGRLEVFSLGSLDHAYVRAPTDHLDDSYVAEAAVSIGSNLNSPIGYVALAGLSGSADAPEVHWAVLIDRPFPAGESGPTAFVNRWALHFVDGDGARTQVSPGWLDTLWHTVDVRVDEFNDAITVTVDAGESHTFHTELGTISHVAAGNLGTSIDPIISNPALYDELAVYEMAT